MKKFLLILVCVILLGVSIPASAGYGGPNYELQALRLELMDLRAEVERLKHLQIEVERLKRKNSFLESEILNLQMEIERLKRRVKLL